MPLFQVPRGRGLLLSPKPVRSIRKITWNLELGRIIGSDVHLADSH
jgi:hypothetical protein